jgi:hypothetical protein
MFTFGKTFSQERNLIMIILKSLADSTGDLSHLISVPVESVAIRMLTLRRRLM